VYHLSVVSSGGM